MHSKLSTLLFSWLILQKKSEIKESYRQIPMTFPSVWSRWSNNNAKYSKVLLNEQLETWLSSLKGIKNCYSANLINTSPRSLGISIIFDPRGCYILLKFFEILHKLTIITKLFVSEYVHVLQYTATTKPMNFCDYWFSPLKLKVQVNFTKYPLNCSPELN